jgi:hypothetical protein
MVLRRHGSISARLLECDLGLSAGNVGMSTWAQAEYYDGRVGLCCRIWGPLSRSGGVIHGGQRGGKYALNGAADYLQSSLAIFSEVWPNGGHIVCMVQATTEVRTEKL